MAKNVCTKAELLAIFCSCASTRHCRFSPALSGERATPVRFAWLHTALLNKSVFAALLSPILLTGE